MNLLVSGSKVPLTDKIRRKIREKDGKKKEKNNRINNKVNNSKIQIVVIKDKKENLR